MMKLIKNCCYLCFYVLLISLIFISCSSNKKSASGEKIDKRQYCDELTLLKEYIPEKGYDTVTLNAALTFSQQIKIFKKNTAPKSEIAIWTDIENFEYKRSLEEIDVKDANKILSSYKKINEIVNKRCNIDFFTIDGLKNTTTSTIITVPSSFNGNGAYSN